MIIFEVPGQPVPKGRARSAKRGNKTIHYTPKKTVDYEEHVKFFARRAMQGNLLLLGPVSLCVILDLTIPKSWSNKKRQDAIDGILMPTTKPDCSNVLKSIEDAMNGIVWHDDSQVVQVSVLKTYSIEPAALITVDSYYCANVK